MVGTEFPVNLESMNSLILKMKKMERKKAHYNISDSINNHTDYYKLKEIGKLSLTNLYYEV